MRHVSAFIVNDVVSNGDLGRYYNSPTSQLPWVVFLRACFAIKRTGNFHPSTDIRLFACLCAHAFTCMFVELCGK